MKKLKILNIVPLGALLAFNYTGNRGGVRDSDYDPDLPFEAVSSSRKFSFATAKVENMDYGSKIRLNNYLL